MVNNVTFCIQTLPHDNSGFSLPSPDSAVLREVIDEDNWLHPEDPIDAMLSSSCADIFQDGEQLIPVGSIEFVESGLRRWYGIERGLTPLFIPEQLRPFANRWVQVAHGKRQVESAIANLGKAFIKSASAVKCDYAGIYHAGQKLPDDTDYFVSQTIDIVSEWRIFVHRGNILDLKNYSGDPWQIPDRTTVEKMVKAFTNTPKAYTLDVAVLRNGQTAVIEVHNFISCGLYGFTSPKLPLMYCDGIYFELEQKM